MRTVLPARPSVRLAMALLGAAPATGLHAQAPRTVALAPLAAPPDIDGRLEPSAWDGAARISLAYEWYPGDNVAPPVATVCFLATDDDHLYVGCRADDGAPEAVRAHYSDRDEIGGDDRISILIDPFGTSRRGFEFDVTALGVQRDALYSEETGSDDGWDAIWESAGRLTDEGYVVEAAIPFRALRVPAGEGGPWRIVLERSHPRSAERRIGSFPLDRNDNCLLCQATRLTGLAGVRAGRDVAVQPTLTAVRTDAPDGEGRRSDHDVNVGISGRWGVSSVSRLNVTLNPDFSQVEADAAEFEVNRRFALSFPEKRLFFLDGADFFDVRGDLVFTRSVVDPIVGAKLTGRLRSHAFGGFATVDRVNSIIVPGSQSSDRVSLDDDVVGFVARYRADLANSSSVGALLTGRAGGDYENGVLAVDAALRLGRSHRLRMVATGSHTRDPEPVEEVTGRRGSFRGARWDVRYDLDARNWAVEAGYRGISRGFRADAGLLQRVDITGPEAQVARVIWGDESAWFDRVVLSVEGQRFTEFGGDVIDEKLELAAEYNGPLQSEIEVQREWRRHAFADRLFPLAVTDIEFAVRPFEAIALDGSIEFGDEIDADNRREARMVQFEVGAEFLLGRALRLRVRNQTQRLSVSAGRVFRALLIQGQLEYHLGLRTFVRAIVQHRDIRRNPELYAEPVADRTNRLFSQLLLSYQVNPHTVLFLGYSGTARDFDGLDVSPDERSFFLKLGYGWQL